MSISGRTGILSLNTLLSGQALDTIGVHRVTVYRAKGDVQDVVTDELIATYWYEDHPWMMVEDEFVGHGSVRLKVETGYRYYALIAFYATLNGQGKIMLYTTKITDA